MMNLPRDDDSDGKLPFSAIVTVHNVVYTAEDLRSKLEALVNKAPSIAEWARQHNINGEFVRQILKGSRTPGGRVLELLGVERCVYYRPIVPGRTESNRLDAEDDD